MVKPTKCNKGCTIKLMSKEYQGEHFYVCSATAAAIDGYNDYMDGELPGRVGGKMPVNVDTANMWSKQVSKAFSENGKFPVG